MKILRLIGSMNPLTGGPCQGIRNSIAELSKLGIYNEVVCLDAPTASFIANDSFIIHALGPGKGPWHYSSKLVPWLIINLPRFDVLIVHGLWLYSSYAARLARQTLIKQTDSKTQQNIPKLFVMPHGHLDPYFQEAAPRRLKAIRNWLYWKLIEHKVIRDADGLLFTTETELLLARLPFRPYQPKQEINVGYGIEAPPAYTQAMRQAFLEKCPAVADEPFLLFLSRIHQKKGTDLLVEAYIALSRQLADSGIKLPALVIAGPGIDTDFGQSVRQMAHQNPDIRSRIYFPGMLTGNAKWGAFYGCDVFVLPSHQENFGIAVAEALGCSKPVLISDQVNIWREIESGEGGLVAPNTLAGTQELLERWLALAADTKKAMGANAKATFNLYFAVEPAAKRFKDTIMAKSLDRKFY